jgi:PEP-CTERM motif
VRKYLCLFVAVFALSLPSTVSAAPIVFSVGGDTSPASILTVVNNFRALLGDPNNGNVASTIGGRREINWDGGGSDTTPGGTPFNVFLNTRGGQFTTPGSGFVQAPDEGGPGGGFETVFSNLTYGDTFNPFSNLRLFAPVGSNIVDAAFFLPGTNGGTPATVSGFGAVFTDVDLLGSASIQFFDAGNNSLGTFQVPAGTVPNGSLSFLGVIFTTEQIAGVRILSGTGMLGPDDNPTGGTDIVAMDDFLYSEPVALAQGSAIPEPSTLALFGAGATALAARLRRRQRN